MGEKFGMGLKGQQQSTRVCDYGRFRKGSCNYRELGNCKDIEQY